MNYPVSIRLLLARLPELVPGIDNLDYNGPPSILPIFRSSIHRLRTSLCCAKSNTLGTGFVFSVYQSPLMWIRNSILQQQNLVFRSDLQHDHGNA